MTMAREFKTGAPSMALFRTSSWWANSCSTTFTPSSHRCAPPAVSGQESAIEPMLVESPATGIRSTETNPAGLQSSRSNVNPAG